MNGSLDSGSRQERTDYCFTCTQTQKALTVTVWDVGTGVTLRTYSCDAGLAGSTGLTSGRIALCVLRDSHLLCAPRNVPFIYVWNLQKEQVLLKIACAGIVRSLHCTSDGVFCAGAIAEKIYIWHICTGDLLAVVSQHYQPVNVIKFSDDGVHFVSGGDDSRVLVWQLNSVLSDSFMSSNRAFLQTPPTSSPTPLTRHVWSDHSLPVQDLHCSRGGLHAKVVTVSLDQTCKVYEMVSGSLLHSVLFDFGLSSVTLDLAGQWIFVGASNGKIFQVDLQSKLQGAKEGNEDRLAYSGHGKPVTGLQVSSWSNLLVSSSSLEQTVRVWDITSRQTIKEVKQKGGVIGMVASGGSALPIRRDNTSASISSISRLSIKPFKKQLPDPKSSTESSKRLQSVPIQLRGIDPLCDLSELQYLEAVDQHHILPSDSSVSEKDLTLHATTQELYQLKDIHKKMYTFVMDKVIPQTT